MPSFHRMVEHTGPVKPGRQEVIALAVALEALSDFFRTQRRAIIRRYPPNVILLPPVGFAGRPGSHIDRIEHTAQVNDPEVKGRRLEVRVSLPAEGYQP